MSNIAAIEEAIRKLSADELEQLSRWLEQHRAGAGTRPPVDAWLTVARGRAKPGITTAAVMAETRGEQ